MKYLSRLQAHLRAIQAFLCQHAPGPLLALDMQTPSGTNTMVALQQTFFRNLVEENWFLRVVAHRGHSATMKHADTEALPLVQDGPEALTEAEEGAAAAEGA